MRMSAQSAPPRLFCHRRLEKKPTHIIAIVYYTVWLLKRYSGDFPHDVIHAPEAGKPTAMFRSPQSPLSSSPLHSFGLMLLYLLFVEYLYLLCRPPRVGGGTK